MLLYGRDESWSIAIGQWMHVDQYLNAHAVANCKFRSSVDAAFWFEYNPRNLLQYRKNAMTESVTARGKAVYQQHKAKLERENPGMFVSIEPDSGDLFVADSFDAAVALAIKSHPNKISHTIRIGQEAAFHIGLLTQ